MTIPLSVDDVKITCSKCGAKMTASQERSQVACITTGCPLENAAKAGQERLSSKDKKSLGGIIIGTNPKWAKLSQDLRKKARVAEAEAERKQPCSMQSKRKLSRRRLEP